MGDSPGAFHWCPEYPYEDGKAAGWIFLNGEIAGYSYYDGKCKYCHKVCPDKIKTQANLLGAKL